MNRLSISVSQVCVDYPKTNTTALRGVTMFDIRAGEVHSLVGPNGSGKSTFLQMLSGTLPFYAKVGGSLRVNDRTVLDVDIYTRDLAKTLGVYLVPQEVSVVAGLTVLENIILGREESRRLGLRDMGQARRTIGKLMRDVGHNLDLDTNIEKVPVADRYMTSLYRALASFPEPRLLLLDEPTANLGPDEVEVVHRCIKRLKDRGTGIILVSHRPNDILAVADRVSVFLNGVNVASYSGHEITPDTMASIFNDYLGKQNITNPQVTWSQGDTLLLDVSVNLADALPTGMTGNRKLTFKVSRGRSVAIVSSAPEISDAVFRVIVGFVAGRPGDRIAIDGVPLNDEGIARRRQLGLAVLSDEKVERGLFLRLTRHENLLLPPTKCPFWIWGTKAQEMAAQAARYLSPGIPSLLDSVESLSGGYQQRLVISRELSGGASIIVMRNPTQGLDQATFRSFLGQFWKLVSGGTAAVVVTTDRTEADALANNSIFI